MQEEYMQEVYRMQEDAQRQQQLNEVATGQTASILSSNQMQNLIQWQLDIETELELIERLLRGHRSVRDKDGNVVWKEPTDPEEKLLNEKGVQEVMKVVRMYINKNTLLSNFDEKTILQRVKQFAERLSRFIYMNYEDFGLDTPYKQKHYEMIVLNVTDMIESAYYRALHGGERDSLRTARTVTQTESPQQMNLQGINNPMMQPNRGKWYNPMTWGQR